MSAKIRILYIDDYELDRELVKDALEREHGGFELMEAANKQEFEALLKTHEFDVVLSDFNIAGFEGLQVLEAVLEYDPRIPVIIVTGTGSEVIATQALKQGAADYVIKRPKHIQRLPQTIFLALEKKKLIAEQKNAEYEIRNNLSFLQNLIDTIPSPLFYKNVNGEYLGVNKAFEEFYGKSRNEILGTTVYGTGPKHIADKYHEKDQELFQGLGKQIYEWKVINVEGETRDVIFNKASYTDQEGRVNGLIGIITDITELKQAKKALEESLLKQNEAIKSANVGLWDWDLITNKVRFSVEWKKQIGYEDHEIGNEFKEWENRVHPDDLEPTLEKVQHSIAKINQNHQSEFRFRHKDNSYRWILAQASIVPDENGRPIKMIGSHIDITERKLADEEKMNLQNKLAQAQKMESIGNLAGGIAHDFNNILSSIIGFTELALDDVAIGTPLEDNLQEVYTAGKRARDLVRQILAFARQSDEKLKPIRVDIIAYEVIKLLRSSIPATVEIRESIESQSTIMGNTTQIHQLFMNLCTNAGYSMEDEGGILEISLKDIVVDKDVYNKKLDLKYGKYIELSVSDTGTGIPSEILDSIFDPYFTTKGLGEGTGMGLAMVHSIVESYGGKITVESKIEEGTTFTIYLPIIRERQAVQACVTEQLPTGKERILFVDDEASITKMGSQVLERLGYAVTTRTSSVETIELFRTRPNDFDLVITDMTMPNLTGDKLAIELIKIRPDIPVVLCTGYSKKISDEIASEIGIKAFAYKPIAKADLAKTVRKVLDETKG